LLKANLSEAGAFVLKKPEYLVTNSAF